MYPHMTLHIIKWIGPLPLVLVFLFMTILCGRTVLTFIVEDDYGTTSKAAVFAQVVMGTYTNTVEPEG